MDFFNQVGKLAIGSRLRMLTESIMEDAGQLYELYDTDLQPKWFPVFYVLSQGPEKTITAIARQIGHSHPSVSKIISEMSEKGLVIEKKDAADGRKTLVSLSEKGMATTLKIQHQYTDVTTAVEELSAEATHDLWKAIEEWEYLIAQKSLLRRVMEKRKERETAKVTIVDYCPEYKEAFQSLNEAWIAAHFQMEEADHKALDDPEGYVIDRGGQIIVALYENEPVGVCALLKMDDPDYDYEMAKMAVSPKAQGKNIGWLLGKAIIEKARAAGAKNIYLESNTILKPAIGLYHKLGFTKVTGRGSPYERCNIQMALNLRPASVR